MYQPKNNKTSYEKSRRPHKKTGQVINRLSRAEGHIRAIKRMLEESRSCPDILIQLAAVRAAIDKAGRIVLEDHMESCLLQAAAEGTAERELDELRQALDKFIT